MKNILNQAIDNDKIKNGGIRSLWERRIMAETINRNEEIPNPNKNKVFLFPRWRSVDPMTASLTPDELFLGQGGHLGTGGDGLSSTFRPFSLFWRFRFCFPFFISDRLPLFKIRQGPCPVHYMGVE
uniref:Uncharacterized protein n=1 Tax=Meloidogyne incognita TaxID=6306 RepID=A0A914NE04_MELIC